MTQYANHVSYSFNPNNTRNTGSINHRGQQINPNHRVCQSGDKITINRKKTIGY